MKTINFLLIFSIAFVVAACQKNEGRNNSSIIGSWEWAQSSGGIAGVVYTPETQGYSQTIEFNANDIYKRYRDGQLQEETHYTLLQDTSILSNTVVDMVQYEDDIRQSFSFSSNGDTLFLKDDVFDGFDYIYIRR